jgi:hypothetical protein
MGNFFILNQILWFQEELAKHVRRVAFITANLIRLIPFPLLKGIGFLLVMEGDMLLYGF